MPNHRSSELNPSDLETARPWGPERFAEAEPQQRRGTPGSRDIGDPAHPREEQPSPADWTGVRPLPPLLPSMPRMKTGDQQG